MGSLPGFSNRMLTVLRVSLDPYLASTEEKFMPFTRLSIGRALGVFVVATVMSVGVYADSGADPRPSGKPASAADSMGPMKVPGLGIDNFGLVDGRIYRGEQPKEDEYSALKALGISTIIDLRQDAKSYARTSAESAGLRYINIPMDDKDKPYDEQVATFLKSVLDASNGKVYVHCAGGRHRTGATIAAYRMAVNGWTAAQAYKEMKAYDFYSRWGHGGYKDYVFEYYDRMQKDPASVPMACVQPMASDVAEAMAEMQ